MRLGRAPQGHCGTLALSGKADAGALADGVAHRLLQLGGLGFRGQRRDPEAGQCFVLVLACGARTGAGLGIIWAIPRAGLGREGVEGPAHDGCLLLQEAPHLVLGGGPLQLFLLLPPGAPLFLVGLEAAGKK